MDVVRALADLTEISSQIEAAVVLDTSGALVGATVENGRARALAEAAHELLAAAERAAEGERALAQLEVATMEGSVFIVRDEERTIAAVTTPEPTVGLVFYDLKSCLRSVAAEPPKRSRKAQKEEQKEEPEEADAAS